MRVSILTLGTRGDVQPFIALAKALRARGHEVSLAAPNNFAGWVASHDLEFVGINFDIQAMMQLPQVKALLGGNWLALASIWKDTALPMMSAVLDASWAAARQADVIVYHPTMVGAPDVAEKTGAQLVCAAPIPSFPTREFALITTGRNYGATLNRLSWRLFSLSRAPYVAMINRWRRDTLGLASGPMFAPAGTLRNRRVTRLCAVSPSVVPQPADWDRDTTMTGYWFLNEDEGWQPDGALDAFLAGGDAPIYIGFGSMTAPDPGQFAATVVGAIEQAGVRAVVATGWGALARIKTSASIHVIESAPHAPLFERMCAVVHHGGAGSTAAGLRAGRPTLVCPQTVDQPFWGQRVAQLGCGPEPLPLKGITAHKLAGRLRALVDEERFARSAAAVAQSIAREDGLGVAVSIIEAG